MLKIFSILKLKYFDQMVGVNLPTPYLNNFFSSHEILCQFSCPHTLDQIGVAERKYRHIVETGLSLLVHSGLPTYYWFEAFNTVVYLINMMPIVSVPKISPYEALFHVVPDYTSL